MDLGIPQKSLRVKLKEENERKNLSFFHEQIERGEKAKENFLSSDKKRAAARRFRKSVQQGQSTVFKARGHENRGEENSIYCSYIGMIPKEVV